MFENLIGIGERLAELHNLLGTPEIATSAARVREYGKEIRRLEPLVEAYREYQDAQLSLDESRTILQTESDPELLELAREQQGEAPARLQAAEQRLHVLLLPRDPYDDKNILLEIRAGTGGEEATLFAAELFRMYGRFAERRGWRMELVTSHLSASGGFKEVIASLEGPDVYSVLKWEAGVHRVQRVPETESQGRIHTSAVTVAVLPEAEEVEVEIADKDLRIDVYRSSGHGGQSVNTTDSAVRITHLPTNTVVICQDEKSQHKNKAQAMKVLRARLFEIKRREQEERERDKRKAMVRSGDRSEKIRTYNYPQNRVTDHRIGLTLHRLEAIIEGDLDEIVTTLQSYYQAEALRLQQGSAGEGPEA